MRFSELDRVRNRYPQLSSYIAAAEDYLQELLARPKPVEIVPSLVAQRLSVDEELVLSVLLLFDEAGIIEPRYQVRCSDSDGVLLEFNPNPAGNVQILSRLICSRSLPIARRGSMDHEICSSRIITL